MNTVRDTGCSIDPSDVLIDRNGVVQYTATQYAHYNKPDSGRSSYVAFGEEIDGIRDTSWVVKGTIGQIFEPDDRGIVETNYHGSENKLFVPGYDARIISPTAETVEKPLAERVRLQGLEQSMAKFISATVDVDIIPPDININDITVYEGIGVNILGYGNCVDEVDGNVPCEVIGTYDKNNLGSYQVLIKASDLSGNISEKTININVVEREKLKYYTEIIRNQNTVIVYELDENKEYTKIARVIPCSTGRGGRTPTGVFYSKKGNPWGSLMGGVYGQYYTVITGDILFHSVPYLSMSKDNLKWYEYNKLGSDASAGCVRLTVEDAKWIYDNCPNGMKIKIYDGDLPDGVVKPSTIILDENNPLKGWDPTDPDPSNPWHNQNN